MAEVTSGWRRMFSVPAVYRLAQRTIGSPNVRETLVDRYLAPSAGDRVLDIGCGTGDLIDHLPPVDFVGFDPDPDYVAAATERFGDRAQFRVGGVGEADFESGQFDLCVAKGVFHHLDDTLAASLVADAARALRPGGRFVSIDPTFTSDQSWLARKLAQMDRGQNVRTPEAYAAIARDRFDDVDVIVHDDLLRVPYNHAVVVAVR